MSECGQVDPYNSSLARYCLLTIADSDFATGAQRVVSAPTNFVNSSGDISLVSMASSASRFWITAVASP